MKRPHELERENQALRDRLARLSEASLRITQDLDFNSVLQGVLDSVKRAPKTGPQAKVYNRAIHQACRGAVR